MAVGDTQVVSESAAVHKLPRGSVILALAILCWAAIIGGYLLMAPLFQYLMALI